MFQTTAVLVVVNTVLFLTFGHLILGFFSDFDIRVSNFALSFGQTISSGPDKMTCPPEPDSCAPIFQRFYSTTNCDMKIRPLKIIEDPF
jgi:hypothetical protein